LNIFSKRVGKLEERQRRIGTNTKYYFMNNQFLKHLKQKGNISLAELQNQLNPSYCELESS